MVSVEGKELSGCLNREYYMCDRMLSLSGLPIRRGVANCRVLYYILYAKFRLEGTFLLINEHLRMQVLAIA